MTTVFKLSDFTTSSCHLIGMLLDSGSRPKFRKLDQTRRVRPRQCLILGLGYWFNCGTSLPFERVTLCPSVFQGPAQPGHRGVVAAARRGWLGLQCCLLRVFGSCPPDCLRGNPKPTERRGGCQQVIMALSLLIVLPMVHDLSVGSHTES